MNPTAQVLYHTVQDAIVIPEKLTVRLGSLRAKAEKMIGKTGETPSEYVRRLIAEDCGVDPPEMRGYEKTIRRVNREKRKGR